MDGDRFITAGELRQRMMERPPEQRPALCAAIMVTGDADHDDTVSLAEFLELGDVLQELADLCMICMADSAEVRVPLSAAERESKLVRTLVYEDFAAPRLDLHVLNGTTTAAFACFLEHRSAGAFATPSHELLGGGVKCRDGGRSSPTRGWRRWPRRPR